MEYSGGNGGDGAENKTRVRVWEGRGEGRDASGLDHVFADKFVTGGLKDEDSRR